MRVEVEKELEWGGCVEGGGLLRHQCQALREEYRLCRACNSRWECAERRSETGQTPEEKRLRSLSGRPRNARLGS